MSQQYPTNPNRSDRIDFNTTFRNMLRYLPCDDPCQKHSKEWIAKNPPDLESRDAITAYMCKFHNSVREKQGKPLVDCNNVGKDVNNCKTCTVSSPSTVNDSVSTMDTPTEETGMRAAAVTEETGEDLTKTSNNKHSLSQYAATTKVLKESKQKKKELFEALCKEYNDPLPTNFRFEPCPNHPETSCIDFHDMKNITPYLNPYTDSDRQVLHEFNHYHNLVKSGKISSEQDAEKFAYSRISKAYPLPKNSPLKNEKNTEDSEGESDQQEEKEQDQVGKEKTQTERGQETGVSIPTNSSSLRNPTNEIKVQPPMPISKDEQPQTANVEMIKETQPAPRKQRQQKKSIDQTIQDIADNSAISIAELDTSLEAPNSAEGYEQRFPNYAKLMKEEEMKKKDQEIGRKLNEGFISHLDPVYKYPARALGLKESHMNLAHTPEIVHNIVMALVQSNTTPVGSGVFSFLTGLSLFVVGYLAKSSIAFRDQIALQNISAAFLWRTLEYINPKFQMKKQIKEVYNRVQEGDLHLSDALIETPGMWRKKEHRKENPWLYIPHRFGRDEKGRPAIIIPAPYGLAAIYGRPGANIGGLKGDNDRNSINYYEHAMAATVPGAGSTGEARNIMAPSPGTSQDPMYQLAGDSYYDIGGDHDDEYDVDSMGNINPEVMRSVFVNG